MAARTVMALLLLTVASRPSQATVYSRCGLVQALRANGLTTNLDNWVCLIENESARNTAAKHGPNSDGSYDYGLFQINSKSWCGESAAGGNCNVKCSAFLDGNIADDIACARKIFAHNGFDDWLGWLSNCQDDIPDVSGC